MDNVTHALAGCVIAAATLAIFDRRIRNGAAADPAARTDEQAEPAPGFRMAAFVLGIICAELPDADLFYAGQSMQLEKLGYLLHHRGYTHTVVFAITSALFAWALTLATRRHLRSTQSMWPLLGVALAGTLSHLALDFTNTYGIHPFWPLNNSWYYGDAVFIIEPLLWIAVLPALFLTARGRGAKGFYAVALAAILLAAWVVPQTGHKVALALTISSMAWIAIMRATRSTRRIAFAIGATMIVEAVFFLASNSARTTLRTAVGPSMKDAALTPGVSNPFCFQAIVVQQEGDTYRAINATVATVSWLVTAVDCAGSRVIQSGVSLRNPKNTDAIVWERERGTSMFELRSLVNLNCMVSAAMRFIRVPGITNLADGTIEVTDLRYGSGAGSFATIVVPRVIDNCPRRVPPWVPPRRDILQGN